MHAATIDRSSHSVSNLGLLCFQVIHARLQRHPGGVHHLPHLHQVEEQEPAQEDPRHPGGGHPVLLHRQEHEEDLQREEERTRIGRDRRNKDLEHVPHSDGTRFDIYLQRTCDELGIL